MGVGTDGKFHAKLRFLFRNGEMTEQAPANCVPKCGRIHYKHLSTIGKAKMFHRLLMGIKRGKRVPLRVMSIRERA